MAGPVPFPEPTSATGDPRALVLRQLAFYRSTVVAKVGALEVNEQRVSRVPSGWSPLSLALHLAYMERRWLVWGFLGEQMDDPWGDHDPDQPGVWVVPDEVTLDEVAGRFRENERRAESILTTARMDELAALGGRFYAAPPTLVSIAAHVLAEYARHAGHLDIAVELAGGPTGE